MTCRYVRRELRRRWLETAPGDSPDLADLRAHLAACAACRSEAELWAGMDRGLAAWPEEPVPADFAAAVMAAVGRSASTAPAAEAPDAAPLLRGLPGPLLAWLTLAGAGSLAAIVWSPGAFVDLVRQVATAIALVLLIGMRLIAAVAAVGAGLVTEHPAVAVAGATLFIALPLFGAQRAARRLRTQV